MRRGRRLVLALALVGAVACGDSATGPSAGTLEIRLATPAAGTDGAVLFTVIGPAAPLSASAPVGMRVFFDALGATTTFVVTGPLPAGAIARIEVPDVRRAGEYAAAILQVAGSDYALRPLSGYSLTVAR
jgi:hypothetical protein